MKPTEITPPLQIVPLELRPELVEPAVEWIVGEWGSSRESAAEGLRSHRECPPALVALQGAEPVGILGYKIFEQLQPYGAPELWINVLYVAPGWRGRGVGSRLVREALLAVGRTQRQSLFVYAHLPALYETLGWQRFSHDPATGMHVLEYKLG